MNVSCDITVNIPKKPLNFKIVLNGYTIFDERTTLSTYKLNHEFIPNDNNILKFYIDGKTNEHTEFKDDVMIDSACIELSNIKLNDIDVTNMALSNDDLITYTHDCNGHDDMKVNVFDSLLGFNGVVVLEFSTPLDEWVSNNTF
jgi:hypothetical protein